MDEPQVVKIIVVSESNAGKTSLLQQYCFKGSIIIFQQQQVVISHQSGQPQMGLNQSCRFGMWLGCLIMCDITNKKSLEAALSWRHVVKDIADEVPIFLIQNKTDLLQGEREEYQTEEYLNQFGQQNNFTCYQISVKLNEKVNLIFDELVEVMIDKGVIKLEKSIIKRDLLIKMKVHLQLKMNVMIEIKQRKKNVVENLYHLYYQFLLIFKKHKINSINNNYYFEMNFINQKESQQFIIYFDYKNSQLKYSNNYRC
ncbi:unnamed protein product [Paramecium pentaurelia]|uniref:Uncharacterized protein n=1 Tax=Paramecium pentaurelia TaxID=43138 RepID=A0A8S1XJ18_9CILI|nr:unnamed protein product [Paramecium pentaurelia]